MSGVLTMSTGVKETNVPGDRYQLTSDPAYYVMAGVFAFLTTALPSALGQPTLMPLAQALALTVFVAIPVRSGLWKHAALVMLLWVALELAVVAGLTVLFTDHMERSFPSGFEFRSGVLAWVFGATAWPETASIPPARPLADVAGVVVGSVATGGLVGNWFLVRYVNVTGFAIGIVTRAIGASPGLYLSIPPWSMLRIAGMASAVILLSEPLLAGKWSPTFYWSNRRVLLISSLTLLVLSFLVGATAPAMWQRLMPV